LRCFTGEAFAEGLEEEIEDEKEEKGEENVPETAGKDGFPEEHDGEADGSLDGEGKGEVGPPAGVPEGKDVVLEGKGKGGNAGCEDDFPFRLAAKFRDLDVAVAKGPFDRGMEDAARNIAGEDHIQGESGPDEENGGDLAVDSEDREGTEVEEGHRKAGCREDDKGEEIKRGRYGVEDLVGAAAHFGERGKGEEGFAEKVEGEASCGEEGGGAKAKEEDGPVFRLGQHFMVAGI